MNPSDLIISESGELTAAHNYGLASFPWPIPTIGSHHFCQLAYLEQPSNIVQQCDDPSHGVCKSY